MYNKKFYEELARKVVYAQKFMKSCDISESAAAKNVASCDEELGLVRALLLTRGDVGIHWAENMLYETDDELIKLTVYKKSHPEQLVVFKAHTLTDLLCALRDWMDENNGDLPCDCDGLTIFHDDDRNSIDSDMTVLQYCTAVDGGWELRIGHELDNAIESWEQARDAFIWCVAVRGEFSKNFSWQERDTAMYNVTGISMAQIADSGT